ncbi:MAG: signal peptidase [Deltaproteobacteria bacterium]|nr:signal peptidase [Deltaproteobacteria bacterium]
MGVNMKEPQEKTKSKWKEYGESLLIAAIIALIVRSFFLQAFKIPSSSMEPTLLIGDHLLVNRLSYVVKVPFIDTVLFNLGKPARGDVVVFRYPMERDKDFIKRVIATEGETVEIRDKVIFINGKRIEDPWGHFLDTIMMPVHVGPKDNFGPVKVPKDSIFVMGDNRDRSLDSRFWLFVKRDDLVGKALILYFSWDRNAKNPIDYIRWTRFGQLIR